jgi:hypothetical protein
MVKETEEKKEEQAEKRGGRNDPADGARSKEVVMVAGVGSNANKRGNSEMVRMAAEASGIG